MSCEHLICAHCTGPVVEGRCPACRAARAHVHHPAPNLMPTLLVAALIMMLLLMLAVRFAH
jgi:hypothetical protein